MTAGIYAIVNKVNGDRYIGSSQDIEHRFNYHKNFLRNEKHDNKHLQRAWEKYKEENFLFIILEICSVESLLDMEQRYLDLDAGCEYNIAKVAGAPMRGMHHSAETVEKLRVAGKNKSNETREKLRIAALRRRQTDEEKQKIREKATGRVYSEEVRRKVGLASSKRRHTEETKKKMSESGRKRWAKDKESE